MFTLIFSHLTEFRTVENEGCIRKLGRREVRMVITRLSRNGRITSRHKSHKKSSLNEKGVYVLIESLHLDCHGKGRHIRKRSKGSGCDRQKSDK